MPIIAIGLALNQTGAFATPGTCNGLSCRLVDRENIQSINSHTRHAITCGPVGNIAAAHVVGDGRRFGVAIVLSHKDDRQFPDASEVKSLMKGALIGGAITKEADGDLTFAIGPGSQASPYGKRETTTDNAIRTEHPFMYVGNVHRATLATTRPCLAPKQFRYHLTDIHTLRNTMAVTPVMAGNEIVISQVGTDTNGNRLLTGIEMHEARNFASRKFLACPLFKLADRLHLLIQAQQLGPVQCLYTAANILNGHSCKPSSLH